MADAEKTDDRWDPVYLNCRREAVLILMAWAVCLLWTVGYSYTFGYNLAAEQVTITLGMPSWVFWGVLVPWMAATVFSCWFSLSYMADDDLGDDVDSGDSATQETADV